MPAPTKTAANVLVGIANMYHAPVGTTDPADSLAFDDAWAAPWVFPGFSEKGLTLLFDRKEKKHMVEEQANPIAITVESSSFKVQFGLAESTLENIKLATGSGTLSTQAAAAGVIGKKTLVLSDELEVLKLGFEAKNPQGFYRRVIIPRVVSVGKIKTEFDRSKNMQIYMAEFEAICPMSDIKIYDKTANAV